MFFSASDFAPEWRRDDVQKWTSLALLGADYDTGLIDITRLVITLPHFH